MILDKHGAPINKSSIPNLDPNFFLSRLPQANISTADINEYPYRYHIWVNACSWVIARNISQLPIILKDKNNKKVEDTKGIIKRFTNPNPFMTRSTFIQIVILNMLLSTKAATRGGQVFVIPSPENGKENFDLSSGLIPASLLPYNDEYISPIFTDSIIKQFIGWKFENSASGYKKIYKNNELIRAYFANPYNWFDGISKTEPAQVAIIQDVLADLHNTKMYTNDAVPSGILKSETHLNEQQSKMYLKNWYENYGGPDGKKIAIMGGGLSFESIGLSPKDMEYSNMATMDLKKILAAFGLNRIAIGDYEQINYATIKEGRKILWEDTYIPIANLITEAINSQWVNYVYDNDDVYLCFDYSNVGALSDDKKSMIEMGGIMVTQMQFSPALAAKISGIQLTDEDIKNNPWLTEKPASTSNPLGDTTGEDIENDEDDEDNENKKNKYKKIKFEYLKKIDSKEGREKYSNDYIEKVLSKGEKRFLVDINRFFISQRNRMQDKVDTWLSENKSIAKDVYKAKIDINKFLLSYKEEDEKLYALIKPLVKNQLLLDKKKLEEEINLISWNVTDEKINKYVDRRKKALREINTTTFNRSRKEIAAAIKESMDNNLTVQETAKLIKKAIGEGMEIRANQSVTIARTETGIISNEARNEAFKEEGIEYHQWITANIGEVRDSHKAQDGQIRKIGDPFSPTGLSYPMQQGAPLDEIINCRCVTIAVEKP